MPCLTYFHQTRCNPPQSKYFTERKIPWGSSRIFLQGEWNHVTVALCRQLVYSDPAQGREWLWNGYQLQEGRTRHAFGFVCIPQPKKFAWLRGLSPLCHRSSPQGVSSSHPQLHWTALTFGYLRTIPVQHPPQALQQLWVLFSSKRAAWNMLVVSRRKI